MTRNHRIPSTQKAWQTFCLISKSPDSPGYGFPQDLFPTILHNLLELEFTEDYDNKNINNKIKTNPKLISLYVDKNATKEEQLYTQIRHVIIDDNLLLLNYINFKYRNALSTLHSKENLIYFAICYENLNLAIYLHKFMKFVGNNDAVSQAASKGHLSMLKYLHKEMGLTGDNKAVRWAAGNGHLDIVMYLHKSMGLTGDTQAIEGLSKIDRDMRMLKYLHEEMGIIGNETAILNAAMDGRLDMIKYMHEKMGITCNNIDALRNTLYDGHLDILVYLHEKMGIDGEDYLMSEAAYHGYLDICIYMHEKMGLKCNNYDIVTAAKHGYHHIVAYLRLIHGKI